LLPLTGPRTVVAGPVSGSFFAHGSSLNFIIDIALVPMLSLRLAQH
jgi:hypothetical protein